MLTRLRRVVREDDGFSLIELLTALAIGSIVLTAVMTVFTNGLTGTTKIVDRTDATQRVRLTSDTISSLLQAAVCNQGTAPITNGTATSITFTGILGGPDDAAVQYRVRWDSPSKKVYEDIYLSNGQVSANDSTATYPSTPTSTKVIGTDMMPQDGATLFRYFPFSSADGQIGAEVAAPGTTATALKPIVAIQTSLLALPSRSSSTTASTAPVVTQSVVGQVDPSNPGQGTQC